jgi:hypothetical protein
VHWNIGDIVIKKKTRQSDVRALQPKYEGKYEIIEIKEGERLRLRSVENPDKVIDGVANQVRILTAREEEKLVEVAENSDEHEVKQILCEATLPEGRHYLVEYSGFPSKRDWWWQPANSVGDGIPAMVAFKQRSEADRLRMPHGKSLPRANNTQRKIAAHIERTQRNKTSNEEKREGVEQHKGQLKKAPSPLTQLPVQVVTETSVTKVVTTKSGRVSRPNHNLKDAIHLGNMYAILAATDRRLDRAGMV